MIEIYAKETDILRVLPFESIQGNAYRYGVEQTLPGAGFRALNAAFTESAGVLDPRTDPIVICGGDLDVDRFLIKTNGPNVRTTHETMKLKALSHKWSDSFINGDSASDANAFDGMKKRITGAQLFANGATAGGDALSIANLDAAIDAVSGPTHLLMSKAMRRILTSAAHNTGVGGFIAWSIDQFGQQIALYRNLPILLADRNEDYYQTLAFNEANPGGGSAVGTSIYIFSIGDGRVMGIQNGPPMIDDLGLMQTGAPVYRTRFEWYAGLTFGHTKSAARLYGIKNAAAVA